MNEQMTVVAKLVKATQELGSFAADKHNPQGRYDYISADQVLGRIGKVLAANGVMVIPAITRTDHLEGQTGKGTKSYVCNIEFCMKITDGDSAVDMFWAGSGVDYGSPDKALYKAITSGHKYFLMKLFNVGIGNEDGEHDEADAQPQQRPQTGHNGAKAPQAATQPANGSQSVATLPTATADETFGETDTPWYATARASLQNGVAKFAEAALGYHRDGGPASERQYQYLVGLLDSIVKDATGADDGHKRVLAVLCQTEIGVGNPPSAKLASSLLDKLATHKKEGDVKVANQAFEQRVVDACVTIYRAAEAVSTPTLFAGAA